MTPKARSTTTTGTVQDATLGRARRASTGSPDRQWTGPGPGGRVDKPLRTGGRMATLTCPGCDSTWTAPGACHCSGCHRTFAGLKGFDAHRKWGQCVDPSTLRTKDGRPVLREADGIWRSADDRPAGSWPTAHTPGGDTP